MGRDTRFVMDQTGDTARVILEEYEGYTTDEIATNPKIRLPFAVAMKQVFHLTLKVVTLGKVSAQMVEMMRKDNILRRSRKTRDEGKLSISDLWWKSEIRRQNGHLKILDDFNII